MGELRIMEPRVHEVPVILLLHFPEQVGCVAGTYNGLHPRPITIDSGEFEGPGDIQYAQVVEAAEHVNDDQVLVELELGLEGVIPGED